MCVNSSGRPYNSDVPGDLLGSLCAVGESGDLGQKVRLKEFTGHF